MSDFFANYHVCPLKTQIEFKRSAVRKKLLKTGPATCLVSNITDISLLECAHIVPRHIGYDLGFPTTDALCNVVFLNRLLHKLFDNYMWYFDVISHIQDDSPAGTFKAEFVALTDSESLAPYHRKFIDVPLKYFCGFYLHQVVACSNGDQSLYLEAMNEPFFVSSYKQQLERSHAFNREYLVRNCSTYFK